MQDIIEELFKIKESYEDIKKLLEELKLQNTL